MLPEEREAAPPGEIRTRLVVIGAFVAAESMLRATVCPMRTSSKVAWHEKGMRDGGAYCHIQLRLQSAFQPVRRPPRN